MNMGDKIIKKAEELKGTATRAAGKLTGNKQPGQEPPAGRQEGTTGDVISLRSWMGDIPDDVLVTALSIPGTHDSGCIDGPLGFAKTQNLDEEDRFDSSLGDFAPSEVVGRLSRGGSESSENARSFDFDDEFDEQTWGKVGIAPSFYNYAAFSPGDRSATFAPAFTPATTLGDVRGKIVLLRRFQSGRDMGFDVTYWLDNATTRSSEDENGIPEAPCPRYMILKITIAILTTSTTSSLRI